MRTIEQDVRSAPSSNSKDDDRFAEYPEPPRSENAILILTQLLEQKRLIFKATAISMLIGLILAFVLPVCFTADTKIMPPKQSQSALSLMMSQIGIEAGTMTDGAAGGLGLKDPNAIYLGLLKSRPVVDKMIQRFNLMSVYRVKDMTDARKELEKNTLIESEKSSLISISVTDHDKSRAADMANAYTEILRDLTKSVSVSEASRRRLSFLNSNSRKPKKALLPQNWRFNKCSKAKAWSTWMPSRTWSSAVSQAFAPILRRKKSSFRRCGLTPRNTIRMCRLPSMNCPQCKRRRLS